MFFYETRWEGCGEEENTWEPASSFVDIDDNIKAQMRRAREHRVSDDTKVAEQPNSLYELDTRAQAYMTQAIGKYVRSDLLFESVMDSLRTNNCTDTEMYQPGPNTVLEDYDDFTRTPNKLEQTTKMIHTLAQHHRVRQLGSSHTIAAHPRQKKGPGGVVSRKLDLGGSILAINLTNPLKRPTVSLSGSAAKPHLMPVHPLRGYAECKSFTVVAIDKCKSELPKVELGYSVLTEAQKLSNKLRIQAKDPYVPPPKTRKQMLKDPYCADYIRAEEEEITSLWSFSTWGLVRRSGIPRQGKTLKTKWVYADKLERDGRVGKLKARLTAMGCFQRMGIDYHETFASVSRTQTLRVLMVIYNSDPTFSCVHWDIKSAFVNAPIDENIWIEQPDGHNLPLYPRLLWVFKLFKALYGTKQAAHAWQQFLKRVLGTCGAVSLMYDDAVYKVVADNGGWVLLGTHVDDIFGVCNQKGAIIRDRIREIMSESLIISDDGEIRWALKARIDRDAKAGLLKISQEVYIRAILARFESFGITESDNPAYAEGVMSTIMEEECNTDPGTVASLHEKYPFYEAIGCVWWAANISQPMIYPAVHRCAQYIACPSEKLWKWVLKIFGYLKMYPADGLVFQRHKISDTKYQQTVSVSGRPNLIETFHPLLCAEEIYSGPTIVFHG